MERFLHRTEQPDVLCLQETKCPDDLFPHAPFEALGYTHRLIHGMKGYNGVAIVSRVPFSKVEIHHRVMREDCRHVRAWLDVGGDPIGLDNLYIPAGGDIPDPVANVKFAHKLDFYREIATWYTDGAPKKAARKGKRAITVGDLNVAPLEHDVWSHKQLLNIVSHTPVEVELFGHMLKSARMDRRAARVHAGQREALFVVELSQPGLAEIRPRPAARPHPRHAGAARRDRRLPHHQGHARLGEGQRPRAGDRHVQSLRCGLSSRAQRGIFVLLKDPSLRSG